MSTMAMPQPTASEAAVRYLITNYSPKGNKVGWLMMASIWSKHGTSIRSPSC